MGGDPLIRLQEPHSNCFNPRPRMGGDIGGANSLHRSLAFQSAPPHGGRPVGGGHHAAPRIVSIRAPAWGATDKMATWPVLKMGFNPRPRMGGDAMVHTIGLASSCFNPRPRMGGDRSNHGVPHGLAVSIRAPAWGATLGKTETALVLRSFNPRPRMGGDMSLLAGGLPGNCFNPRPRMGGDGWPAPRARWPHPFQSAPPHGGRRALPAA